MRFRVPRIGCYRLLVPVLTCGLVLAANPQAAQPLKAADPQVKQKVNDLFEDILESEVELQVTYRRSKILRMKEDIFRAAVADPSLIEVVAFGSREVEVIGKETGSTSLTLWLGDENNARVVSILVTVTHDPSVDDKRRLEYGEFQQMINEAFPNSKVQLIPIADKVIVRGQARDEEEATQIMSLIRENAGRVLDPTGNGLLFASVNQGQAASPHPDATILPDSSIISMLEVPGVKQVMLKVRIAELKRSALRALGADFDFEVGDFFLSSVLTDGGNILATGTFDNDSFNLVLRALETNSSAKILAEPNLVTLSGQTASFISGGQFAVPTVVGVGGAEAATTTFKGFGTLVEFTPVVLDKDRIRLTVAPEFSTLNSDNSVNGIFGLDTRATVTTVELREGQVLAIAGLLQEQQSGSSARIPIIGNIPVLNWLAANRSVTRDETELLILVTPELVHPLEPEDAPTILPGMEVTEPDDHELYFYGQIEGDPCCHHRSTVWQNYVHRMKKTARQCERCRHSDDYFIYGPHGFSD